MDPKNSNIERHSYTQENEDVLSLVSPGTDNRLVDMTSHADISGDALRVELRRTRDPATANNRASPSSRIMDSNFIVGLISPEQLPQEGKNFQIAYHSWNGKSDFGFVDSFEPITNLIQEDNCYYFETSEGQWRLKILSAGN